MDQAVRQGEKLAGGSVGLGHWRNASPGARAVWPLDWHHPSLFLCILFLSNMSKQVVRNILCLGKYCCHAEKT